MSRGEVIKAIETALLKSGDPRIRGVITGDDGSLAVATNDSGAGPSVNYEISIK